MAQHADVAAMLAVLEPYSGTGENDALGRLSDAAYRIIDGETERREKTFVQTFLFVAAHIVAPALLLYWADSSDSWLVPYVITEGGSLALILLSLGLRSIVLAFAKPTPRDLLWAAANTDQGTSDGALAQLLSWLKRRALSISGTAAAIAVGGLGLWQLREDPSRGWKLIWLVVLTPLTAAVLAGLSGLRDRAPSRRSRSIYPGDAIMIGLLNLAYFSSQGIGNNVWNRPRVRQRTLDECERVAREAEREILALDGVALRCDPATRAWARSQSAKLAASVRQLKRKLLVAGSREDYEGFLREVMQLLDALMEGRSEVFDGDSTEVPRARARRARRVLAIVAPGALLVAAALLLPKIPGLSGDKDALNALRSTLFVAAFLALLSNLSPSLNGPTSRIQSAVDKLGAGRS